MVYGASKRNFEDEIRQGKHIDLHYDFYIAQVKEDLFKKV